MLKARHKKTTEPPCAPVGRTVAAMGGKWKPIIIFYLMKGSQRFNELQRLCGNPSARILTVQLRELEDDKLVKRQVYDQVPPKVEYSLTEKGKSLSKVLDVMAKWGLENK